MKIGMKQEQRSIVQCTVVGDGMVGKSCLSLTFADKRMPASYIATVFENYAGKTKVAGDEYTVSVFDSAGQHDYERLRAFTYKDSEALVMCYSVVDRDSFESVREFWIPEMKRYMGRKKPVILVATQIDLRNTPNYDTDMPVTEEEGAALAREIHAEAFIECSMEQAQAPNVRKVFQNVVSAVLRFRKKKSNILNRIMGR